MLYRDEGDAGRGELLDRGHELSQVPTEPIKAPRHDRINATLPAISWSRACRRSFVTEPPVSTYSVAVQRDCPLTAAAPERRPRRVRTT